MTHVHRQDGDENKRWRDLLSRLRRGNLTHEDIKLLETRKITPIASSTSYLQDVLTAFIECEERGEAPVCLLSKKCLVEVFNNTMIERKQLEPCKLWAHDKYMGSNALLKRAKAKMETIKDDSRLTGGLETCLVLSKGARVMLTRNLCLERGLVNGAIGYHCA